jgi:glutathione synthase/RimK-type ligase-like ATP-grasp enzyme
VRGRIINWGIHNIDDASSLINQPTAVMRASNKIMAFAHWQPHVRIPEWTTSRTEAERWLTEKKAIVLARATVTGSQGSGISILRTGDAVPNAPLYVRYVKKTHEYRVHVVGGNVVFVQQKRKRSGVEVKDDGLIRNHDRGWVFCENEVDEPSDELKAECVRAVGTLGLDFGAVDVIVNKQTGEPVILEVNTAPGIESTRLLESYVQAFTSTYGI